MATWLHNHVNFNFLAVPIQTLIACLLLLKKLEGALLGDVAQLLQLLDSLLARSVLLARNDATLLGLHQVLLGQATGSVLGSAVVNLSLGADSHLRTTNHVVAIVAILASNVRSVAVHFYIHSEDFLHL
jgi:hypothetical protein